MSDETSVTGKDAPVRKTTARGGEAKARVQPSPATAKPATAKPASAKANSPKPETAKPAARKASAPKTTALKSAALKAAAAPRAEAPARETLQETLRETPAEPVAAAPAAIPAPAEVPAPADIPAPTIASAPKPASPAASATASLQEEAFSLVGLARLPSAEGLVQPYARMMETTADGARTAYAQARETNESLAQACFESANAASRGMAALNAQMLDVMRANTDLTLSLMRSTLTAGSLSEAIRLQTSGAREAYEANAAHMKALAATTTKLVGEATQPLAQAMTRR